MNDVWYFEVETMIASETRGFSLHTRARPDGRTVPTIVNERCMAFLADVVDSSDVHVYDAVTRGDRDDWPYRSASYVLSCNGVQVVRSFAVRPIKPEVVDGS